MQVGVLIGKSGDTIRYLQINSGAKIQIMRDADADPYAPTRPVEIIGTLDSINKAEKLISAVIAEVSCCLNFDLFSHCYSSPYDEVHLVLVDVVSFREAKLIV